MLIPREAPALLSIVIPMYNEELVLPLLRHHLTVLTGELLCRVEIILVDDGSVDQTYPMMHAWALEDPEVKILALSRNFGHQVAITAGMDASSGDAVVIMDADLQDPPALIPEMVRAYCEGYEVVYGQRTERDGETWFKRATAAAFYGVMRRFVDRRLPANTGDFRLISRRVVEDLRRIREHDRFVRGIVAWLGYPQRALPYRRPGRAAGTTKYPLRKMIRLALDGVVGSSDLPLRLILRAGIALTALSVVVLGRVGVLYLDDGHRAARSALAGLIGLVGGAVLIALGVVALYVARIHDEVRGRPLYLVRHSRNFTREPR